MILHPAADDGVDLGLFQVPGDMERSLTSPASQVQDMTGFEGTLKIRFVHIATPAAWFRGILRYRLTGG